MTFKELPIFSRQHETESSSGGSTRPEQKAEQEPVWMTHSKEIIDAHFGDYASITQGLSEAGILPKNIEWITEDLKKKIPEATFLDNKDYEMLFVLRMFHPETYEHSVRTYVTGREKIMSPPQPVGAYLRTKIVSEISGEDISSLPEEDQKKRPELNVMYRALLLHDMGKIAVPAFILDDTHGDTEWKSLGEAYCSNHGDGQGVCYEKKLSENPSLRYKDVVPVGLGLDEEQKTLIDKFGKNLPAGYEKYRYDSNSPLGAIITIHADISGDVLKAAGYTKEAAIVREHHRAEIPSNERIYPVSDATLSISKFTATLVHAADFLDAMRHARSYKRARHIFDVEQQFMREVENKKLPQEMVDGWILRDIEEFEAEMQDFFLHSGLSAEKKSEIGGPFNYYISQIPPEEQSTEREKMQILLEKYRPRTHIEAIAKERRQTITQ